MDRLKLLLNKYGHIYNEEEAIEVEFRHRMEGRKLPKYIGYYEEQNKRYLNIQKVKIQTLKIKNSTIIKKTF